MKKFITACLFSTFLFAFWCCQTGNRVEFIQLEDQVDIVVNEKLIASYLFGSHLSKPILYPVKSPSGEVVTRWYPFKIVEGESSDHPHQAGVFFTYGTKGEVKGTNFWANPHDRPPLTMDPKLPRVKQDKVLEMKGGRGKGRLATINYWVDKDGKPILEESRVMEFHALDDEYKIDFTINLKSVDNAVTFGDTKEGMFAIRVADWLAEGARGTLYESTGEYLNAAGEIGGSEIWGKRSEWVKLEGERNGKRTGVAIFHHPLSVNYPTYWHARGYGLFSANPIGQFDFQKDRGYENPVPLSLRLNPGESALFKFRMVIYDGTRGKEQLDKEFEDFSNIMPIFTGTSTAPGELPKVLPENRVDLIYHRLRNEAYARFATYQLPLEMNEWEDYKENLRSQIVAKTGFSIDHDLPLDIRVTKTIPMPGYKVENIYFQTMPGIYATANLYIPSGSGPFPAVIVMCGHSRNGRLYEPYQAIGHSLAVNDYVALVIDPWGAGERTTVHGEFEYHGANLGASLMNLGESLLGLQVTDNMRGVDLLRSLPYVDKDNIGATGASGGGNQTMWLAAMDERVKAAIPVVSVGTFESYVMRSNCICETLVDGLTFTEEAGVMAMARAIMPVNVERDNPAFITPEMIRSYENAKPVFEMRGVPDNISWRSYADLTHGYHPEMRESMLGWFDLVLKGKGTGEGRSERTFDIVAPGDLMTFSTGERDPLVVNTEDYCRKRGVELRELYLGKKSFNVNQKREELAELLRLNDKAVLKEVYRYTAVDGWDRFALETSDSKLIPVLHRAPVDKSREYVVLSDPGGKNNIPRGVIDDARKKGAGLAIVDLSGTGEMESEADAGRVRKFHTLARAELWLGKRLLGEWVKELDIVAGFLRSEFNAHEVSFDGSEEAGLAGLFLGATAGNTGEIILRDAPVSYLFDNRENVDFFSVAIHLFGFLEWGDISLVGALTGNDVTFIRPLTMSGGPVTGNTLERYKAEFDNARRICNKPGRVVFY